MVGSGITSDMDDLANGNLLRGGRYSYRFSVSDVAFLLAGSTDDTWYCDLGLVPEDGVLNKAGMRGWNPNQERDLGARLLPILHSRHTQEQNTGVISSLGRQDRLLAEVASIYTTDPCGSQAKIR